MSSWGSKENLALKSLKRTFSKLVLSRKRRSSGNSKHKKSGMDTPDIEAFLDPPERQPFKPIENQIIGQDISQRRGSLKSYDEEPKKIGVVQPMSTTSWRSGSWGGCKESILDELKETRLSLVGPEVHQIPDSLKQHLEENNDEYLFSEYHIDVLQHLKTLEDKYTLNSIIYLETPGGVTGRMRKILVDWLIQVQKHLGLQEETLHMGVALIDRYASTAHVRMSRFQLLGITCLFISAKYYERFAPEIDTLIHLTDYTYNYLDLLKMEYDVLNVLKFGLGHAEPLWFLEIYLNVHPPQDDKMKHMSMYFLDLSLTDGNCIPFKPSRLAAAALCLARSVLLGEKEPTWTPDLAFRTGYRQQDIFPCLTRMAWLVTGPESVSFQAARDKYSDARKFGSVSLDPILSSTPVLPRLLKSKQFKETYV